MTISQLKTAVLAIAGITTDWVRSKFGDLRLKSTWQAAYDLCSEFVAVTADRTATVAQYSAAVLVPCLWAVLWFAFLCYHAGEALAGWWHGEAVVDWVGTRSELDDYLFEVGDTCR